MVKTKTGWLEGKIIEKAGSRYHSFKGIPYAEPPIGKRRFQASVPKNKWNGVRPAFEHGSYCANRWGFFSVPGIKGGNEDCLFLNVYTKNLEGLKPVMFWIHGGALMSGNGDTTFYGPEHLVKEDVVVVTINYRYSAFGFLSTADENAPGNQGFKDIVLALKWVKENIKKFGGDPDNVTIFGHSAGSAATHYLLLSDSTDELFSKAIMMSGSSLMPCHFQPDPKPQAETLAQRLNISFSNTKDLIEKLQNVDFQDIVNVESNLFTMGFPWALRPFEFGGVIEPKNTENAFLTESPVNRLINENYKKVPLMIGSPNFEGMFVALYFSAIPNGLKLFNSIPNLIVPISLELEENSAQMDEAIKVLKNLYFNGETEGDLIEWLKVYSDGIFRTPDDRAIRYYLNSSYPSVYHYEFAFDGTLNFFKKNLSLQNFDGACHGDELFYLFEPDIPGFIPDEKSSLIRNRMVKLWTNFAKFG
jgi:carboxylesterase type B